MSPVDQSELHPSLVVIPSNALKGLFSKIRDKNASPADFVQYSKRIMRLLAEESLAEFPAEPATIETACGVFDGVRFAEPSTICAVSIVRSGDALLEVVRDCVPTLKVGKILIQRDESHPDKVAKLFYSKLPRNVGDMYVLLCDPMLATGGSAKKALEVLIDQYHVKPSKIVFANVICAPEGLQAMAAAYPAVKIVTACIDSGLNDDKYIVPGLGDYGDRFFQTE